MPTAKVLMKNCKHCSAPMERKRINGRLEDFTVFQKRKFCDQKCMAEAMLKEDPSRSARNKMARKIGLKPACEKCGTTQKLAIQPEERHLDARFGKKYREYAKRVRRWICTSTPAPR